MTTSHFDVTEFGLELSIKNLLEITDKFRLDIENASTNINSSLSYAITITKIEAITPPELTQVMVIGGTNFQNCIYKKNKNGSYEVDSFNLSDLPNFDSQEDLYYFIYKNFDKRSNYLSINLGYELNPVLNKFGLVDGEFIWGGKGNSFKGLHGKRVGECIADFMKAEYGIDLRVAVVNDTVCLTLAGASKLPNMWESKQTKAQNLFACVIGTGYNLAFYREGQVVALEAGNFDKYPISPFIKYYQDDSSISLAEKEISGAYLYKHFNAIVTDKQLDIKLLSSSEELSNIAAQDPTALATQIANLVLNRSAAIVAIQMYGLQQYLYSLTKNTSAQIVIEGGVYWKAYKYKERLSRILAEMSADAREANPDNTLFSFEFFQVEDSSLRGGLKLLGLK